MGKARIRKHILEERTILMDQVSKFAAGDTHPLETRDGQMEEGSEERLKIILGQVREIDSILNDPDIHT